MNETFTIKIDGKECQAHKGQTITQVARNAGVFIPTLCDFEGLKPVGSCRICTVKIQGRAMAACTTQVSPGMEVENNSNELTEYRKMLLEMLFVEGNHFCPACEKSGSCELQALAYRYQIMAPRFSYFFTPRPLDAASPKLIIERNRCILCKRCVRGIRSSDGKAVFAFRHRGGKVDVIIDRKYAFDLSDEQAREAMDMCPVGAIIQKGRGFSEPIGTRKYDVRPIGADFEKNAATIAK